MEEVATALSGNTAATRKAMEEPMNSVRRRGNRMRLSEVVADCVERWFRDALEEAKAGDAAMQVLVGQMYQSGYGVPRDEQKAKAWLTKASRHRSSVWKVSKKLPGYNVSDSDSDETKNMKS
ncbi:hypothetical protein HPP92_013863 [Vanilla planifolia]|uniref:Uncharacterized protein n=1 Tax=Vanilla planifolia TaxID=51239 RepID=A0A835UWW2_VANPL|nr:hypothetical protein HPP92_013863 [Vanilla planifolia]